MLELKKPATAQKRPKTKEQFIRAAKADAPMKKPLPFNGGPQTKDWLDAISIKMRKTVSHAVEELVERVHGDAALQKRVQDFKEKYPAEPPMKQVNLLVPLATHRQLEDLHYGAGMHAKGEYLRLMVAYFAHHDYREVCKLQKAG
jgi:hypothetical protein